MTELDRLNELKANIERKLTFANGDAAWDLHTDLSEVEDRISDLMLGEDEDRADLARDEDWREFLDWQHS